METITSNIGPHQSTIEEDERFNVDKLIDAINVKYVEFWQTSDHGSRLFEAMKSTPATSKSTAQAIQFRNLGNEEFSRARDLKALDLYTKSIAFAVDGSEELALAYANRSAVLIRILKYVPCLLDINRALAGKYPANLQQKLFDRKEQCLILIEAANKNGEQLTDNPIKGDETDLVTVDRSKNNKWQSVCNFQNRLLPNASKKIKLSRNDLWGRLVEATEDIEPGEILSSQEFFVKGLHVDHQYTHCAHCLALCYALIPCPSCTDMMYCSRQCLTEADKAYHRTECKLFIQIQSQRTTNLLGYSAQFLATRALLIGTKQGVGLKNLMEQLTVQEIFEEKSDTADMNDYLSMLRLCRTYKQSLIEDGIQNAIETIMVLQYYNFFQTDTDYQSHEAMGSFNEMKLFATMLWLNHVVSMKAHLFCVPGSDNSLNSSAGGIEIGNGICTFHGFFNHSCDPNAIYCVLNQKQVLFAVHPIKKNEQIFIAYTKSFSRASKTTRNEWLSSIHNFICQCEACVNEWPVADDLMKLKTEFPVDKWDESMDAYLQEHVLPVLEKNIRVAKLSNLEILQIVGKHCKWLYTIMRKPSIVLALCDNFLRLVCESLADATDPFKIRQLLEPFLEKTVPLPRKCRTKR